MGGTCTEPVLNDTNWDLICVTLVSNVARNDASVRTLPAFFLWGLLLRVSGLKVVPSAVRTPARNVARTAGEECASHCSIRVHFGICLAQKRYQATRFWLLP